MFTNLTTICGTSGNGNNRGFCNCTNLKHIKLPESLTTIGRGNEYSNGVFKNTAIEELVIPASVVNYAYTQHSTFGSMPKLRKIEFKGLFYNRFDGTYGVNFGEDPNLEEIILAEGDHITTLNSGMFRNCKKLNFTNILHPELITSWRGTIAFFGITVPDPSIGIPSVFYMPNLEAIANYNFDLGGRKQITLLLPQDFKVVKTNNNATQFKAIYVNDDLYEDYLADANWSKDTAYIHKYSEYVEE